jgi:uncharacterized 2Fe-2S/4Fe-4S cluster protein (DUF4445 family)
MQYAIAVDVGTTTISASLLDLVQRQEITREIVMNPQREWGADIVTRMTKNYSKLRRLLNVELNNLILKLCRKGKILLKDVKKILVVSNAVIDQYLKGHNQFERLPMVSRYVGSDALAGALYTDLDKKKGNYLLIDLGTNAEMVLSKKGHLFIASAAAGPAFGHLGSEWITAIAELLRDGKINKAGKLSGKEVKKGILKVTQKKVRDLQLAKAAVRAGVDILLKEARLKPSQLKRILLSGTFGSLVRPAAARRIGMIPIARTEGIGNSALEGAKKILFEPRNLKRIKRLRKKLKFVELANHKDFPNVFIQQINF